MFDPAVVPTPNAVPETAPPIFVTASDAARILGLKKSTLRNWRSKGRGPKFVHVSTEKSPVLYRYSDLLEWADSLGGGETENA